jgi:hypothetical protein
MPAPPNGSNGVMVSYYLRVDGRLVLIDYGVADTTQLMSHWKQILRRRCNQVLARGRGSRAL